MYKEKYILMNAEPGADGAGGGAGSGTDYQKVWDSIPPNEKIKLTAKFTENMGGKFFATAGGYDQSVKEKIDEATSRAVAQNFEKSRRLLSEQTGIEIEQGEKFEDYVKRIKINPESTLKVEETPEFKALKKIAEERNQELTEVNGKLEEITTAQEQKEIENLYSSNLPDLDYSPEEINFVKTGVLASLKQKVSFKKDGGIIKAYRPNGEPYLDNSGSPLEPAKAVLQAATELEGIKIKKVQSSTIPSGEMGQAQLAGVIDKAKQEANAKGLRATSKDYWAFMKTKGVPVPPAFAAMWPELK